MTNYSLLYNSSIRSIMRLCSCNGGTGSSILYRLLEFNVLPLIASFESPKLEIKGKT